MEWILVRKMKYQGCVITLPKVCVTPALNVKNRER